MGLTDMALSSRERPDIARYVESGGLVQIWWMVYEPPQIYKDRVKPNGRHLLADNFLRRNEDSKIALHCVIIV